MFRWGVRILAGLGILPGQAMSQGAMVPGGSVAPPAARVAPTPPPAPTLTPLPLPTVTPPPTVLAPPAPGRGAPPTATVVAPMPGDAGKSISRSTGVPSRWSNAKALPSVGATWSGPGGTGRVVSDGTGTLSLGFLPQGTYDIAFDTSGIGANQPSSRLLVGLLLPGGKKARTASRPFTPGLKGTAKLEVGPNGEAKSILWAWGGRNISTEEEEAPTWSLPGGRDTRLVFAMAADANTKPGK
ncbi:MAG: hypothetical protein Q8K93_18445 [Reyranella sp.]|nr:hypothetical protein [Reyranella sp.]